MQYTEAEPLHMACRTGDAARVSALLRSGADARAPASDGATPRFVACWYGHVAVVRALLDHDGDTSARLTTSIDGGTVFVER